MSKPLTRWLSMTMLGLLVSVGVVVLASSGAEVSARAATACQHNPAKCPTPTPTVTATPTPTVTPTPTPTPTPSPTPTIPPPTTSAAVTTLPLVVSPQQNTGESWAQAAVRTLGYGFTGLVRYYPSGTPPSWDAQLQALAASHPGALTLQVTAKTHSDTGLAQILTSAPTTWDITYNYFQEPEDNLTTAAQQQAYRDTYTAAHQVTAAHGAQTCVEWQEWTVDPLNTNGWNLANFTPPAGDFDCVLWSLFEYGEKAPPNDRLAAQVSRIQSAMATYAPGKPWALMASAYTLEPAAGPFTAAQEQAQADWLQKSYDLTKQAGSTGWAWYNFLQAGTGGASGESRVEKNPAALADLQAFP